MAVIARLVSRGTDEPTVRKAPVNKVFFVESAMFSCQSLVINTMYLLNRHMKTGGQQSPVIGSLDSNTTPNLLAAMKTNSGASVPHNFFVNNINERTKYLTLAYQTANNLNGVVIVYGQIVSETKSNLLWEFITKRHR